uniref:Uncharacterized protein n=1 Tax=Caenorhabditis japonica TaxID=281687 RepID=A0A8R1HG41_CAEJA
MSGRRDSAPKKLILTEDRAWIVSLLKDGDFDSASDFALKKQYITVKPNFDKSKQDSGAEAIQALLRDLGINPEDLQEHQSKKKGGKNKGAGKSKENNNNQKQQKKKDSESKKMDEDSVAASLAKHGTGRNSEEDDNQSFISAQEDVEESISRLSTPPTEFQDARQSRDEGESLMDDPRNYATEDEFAKLAEILNKQNQNTESSEGFITVHHGKKKALKNSEHEATSSTSPQNRRPSSTAGSSSSQPHHHHQQQQQNQGQRNVVRPHATTFGDFVDTTPKKDTHKNTKNKKGGNSGSGGGKKQQQHARTVVDNDPPPPSPMFEDALDRPLPLTVATSSTFSYADVAKTKKSSGDSSPSYDTPSGGTVSPIPPNLAKKDTPSPPQKSKSPSPVPSSSSPSTQNSPQVASFAAAVSGAVQLPPSTAAADDEFQFGYHDAVEEPENRTKKEEKADDVPNASPSSQQQTVQPQRMSGMDLLNQLRNVPVDRMPELSASEAAIQITKVFDDTWHTFMNTGSKPIVYTPGQPTKK